MSGGSFGYLYSMEIDSHPWYTAALEGMAEVLKKEGHHDIAKIFAEKAKVLRDLREWHKSVRGIMQCVEWLVSGDWGEDDLAEVVKEWRERKP